MNEAVRKTTRRHILRASTNVRNIIERFTMVSSIHVDFAVDRMEPDRACLVTNRGILIVVRSRRIEGKIPSLFSIKIKHGMSDRNTTSSHIMISGQQCSNHPNFYIKK